jgi:hypothetical protein
VVTLCGAAITLLTMNKDDDDNNENIIHLKEEPIQPEWMADPADIKNLEDTSDAIVKVRYTGEKHSYKLRTNFFVSTAYAVDVLEVLKGDIPEEHIEISAEGGLISLKDWNPGYPDVTSDDTYVIEKIEQMSDSELAASTMEFEAENGVDLRKGDIAIAFLTRYSEDGKYYVRFGGLSLFEQTANGDYENLKLSSVTIDTATINEIKANI